MLLAFDTLIVVDQVVANSADDYFHALFVPVHHTKPLTSVMEYRGRIIADAAETVVVVVGIVLPVDFCFDEKGFHVETTHQKETHEVTSAYF